MATTATSGTVTFTLSWTQQNTNIARTWFKVLNVNNGAYDSAVMMTSRVLAGTTVTLTVAWTGIAGYANNSNSGASWRFQ